MVDKKTCLPPLVTHITVFASFFLIRQSSKFNRFWLNNIFSLGYLLNKNKTLEASFIISKSLVYEFVDLDPTASSVGLTTNLKNHIEHQLLPWRMRGRNMFTWPSSLNKPNDTMVWTVSLRSLYCSDQTKHLMCAEMVEAMKKVAQLDVELTVEERNLVSVGYKNVIGARRASWRILSSIEQKEDSKGNEENVKRIQSYRKRVEDELARVCNDILSVIDKHLIPPSTAVESTVFFYKMWVLKMKLF